MSRVNEISHSLYIGGALTSGENAMHADEYGRGVIIPARRLTPEEIALREAQDSEEDAYFAPLLEQIDP